ncbi:hypothetical protein F383_28484 [Gossypium arboreum]|uniref:Uncharacterized protein n=1 Tax=Gossypium arboreum TaxID=29729 RepID=A0A0B0MS21_GOSAR|nr:hypothetical protein F383_28484 [Gossypium arboreum]
MYVRWSAYLR